MYIPRVWSQAQHSCHIVSLEGEMPYAIYLQTVCEDLTYTSIANLQDQRRWKLNFAAQKFQSSLEVLDYFENGQFPLHNTETVEHLQVCIIKTFLKGNSIKICFHKCWNTTKGIADYCQKPIKNAISSFVVLFCTEICTCRIYSSNQLVLCVLLSLS